MSISFSFSGLKIQPIAMSDDNYAYMIVNQRTKQIVLVDPADPTAVIVSIHRETLGYQCVVLSP